MQQGYFITGTDTNAGKTWTTLALIETFKKQGKSVAGMKPVASGCRIIDGSLKNEDALLIQQHATANINYELINPFAFALPISPHLAGKENPVDIALLVERFNQIRTLADVILVEGAGGWYTPVNDREDISDLARAFALPVILTVAIKLGCINHAKLTAQAIRSEGLELVGWIAVCLDPDVHYAQENINAIVRSIDCPLLGTLPYIAQPDFDLLADCLDLNGISE